MNNFIDSIKDKDECKYMLEGVDNWCSHRPLLYIALELTKRSNSPILELGCGDGSTHSLHDYIKTDSRNLITFDTNKDWLDKYSHLKNDKHDFVHISDNFAFDQNKKQWYNKDKNITNWFDSLPEVSVCLVDHACGERRHSDIEYLYTRCDIIVIHDSEPEATGYMLDKIWGLFKYRINDKTYGAWTTIVSNKYNLTKLNGLSLNRFDFEL